MHFCLFSYCGYIDRCVLDKAQTHMCFIVVVVLRASNLRTVALRDHRFKMKITIAVVLIRYPVYVICVREVSGADPE